MRYDETGFSGGDLPSAYRHARSLNDPSSPHRTRHRSCRPASLSRPSSPSCMTTPSQATPDRRLDAAAVSAAVGDAALTLFPAAAPGTPPPDTADGVGAFDPATATWHLRTRAGDPAVFPFGTPGSQPLMGDWDGDGIDTVGVYDPGTATVSLRNANSCRRSRPDLHDRSIRRPRDCRRLRRRRHRHRRRVPAVRRICTHLQRHRAGPR